MSDPRVRFQPTTPCAFGGIQRAYVTVRSLLLLALFLAVVPTALASSKWYVDGVNGSDNNDCKSPQSACKTIGHAISLASPGDSIMIAAAAYTENLKIRFSLSLIGADSKTTFIQGRSRIVVKIPNRDSNVVLSNVTVRHGGSDCGGGIYNNGTLAISNSIIADNAATGDPSYGGGICNNGTLTLNHCVVRNNHTGGAYDSYGAGIYSTGSVTINDSKLLNNNVGGSVYLYGGAVFNEGGTLVINRSTISKNGEGFNSGGFGGGIYTSGTTTINDSAFINNSAGNIGGGIYNFSGLLTINNSTISGNVAVAAGGIESGGTVMINNSTLSGNSAPQGGGGIYGAATLQNSIIANSPSGGNCNGIMTSMGYNLSSDGTCNFKHKGDFNNKNPKLGKLGNYGGPTQTIPLLSGSPAIDAGNPNGCTDGHGHLLKTDQRGYPRPDKEDKSGCDMGAYERQSD